MLVCREQLKALMEREWNPQGDLLDFAPLAPVPTSRIGHRSTVPSRCCLAGRQNDIVYVFELLDSLGMKTRLLWPA